MTAFCTHCGEKLDGGARFCTGCGRSSTDATDPAPVAATSSRPRWLLPTALTAVLALAAGAVIVLRDDSTPSVTPGADGMELSVMVDGPESLGELVVSTDGELDAPPPDATTFASPIHVTAGGQESVRSDGPITMTFDLDAVPEDPDLVRVGYWDGTTWWMLRPDTVEGSTVTVTMFHLSWLWPSKLTPEQRDAQMVGRAVNSEVARMQMSSTVDEMSGQYIGAMLKELDITDGATRAALVEAMRQSSQYRELQAQFAKGDLQAFMPALQKAAGAAFGSYLEENSAFLIHPEGIGNKPAGLAAKLGDAYGSFEAGDYDAAGRALSATLIDLLPKPAVFAVWEAGALAIKTSIDLWKHDEIDAAYAAWRDGADGIFFGYNVDPGDFNALWLQMRGIATRLQSEAVTKFEQAAGAAGIEVTDAQRDAVRDQVRAGLLEEFQRRRDNEERTAEAQEELLELLERYEDANLLAGSRFGFDDDSMSREQRFQQLLDIKARIIADLGRDAMSMGAFTTDERVSVFDVVQLTQTLLSGGEDAYRERLLEEYGIGAVVLNPSGTWTGSLVVTTVSAPEDSCFAGAETPSDPVALTLEVAAAEGGGGSVVLTLRDDQARGSLSWSETTVSFTAAAQGGSIRMTGRPTLTEDGGGSITGTFSLQFDEARLSGTWTATRGR